MSRNFSPSGRVDERSVGSEDGERPGRGGDADSQAALRGSQQGVG